MTYRHGLGSRAALAAGERARWTSYETQATSYKLQAISYNLQVKKWRCNRGPLLPYVDERALRRCLLKLLQHLVQLANLRFLAGNERLTKAE